MAQESFERDLVNRLNDYKSNLDIDEKGFFAQRKKQSRFVSQDIDIVLDSLFPKFYAGIECKARSKERLNFKADFRDENQLETIQEFIDKTGRVGILAYRHKRGRGKPRKHYAILWDEVMEIFNEGNASISLDYIKENGVEISESVQPLLDLIEDAREDQGLCLTFKLDSL